MGAAIASLAEATRAGGMADLKAESEPNDISSRTLTLLEEYGFIGTCHFRVAIREDHVGELGGGRQPGEWGSRASSTSICRASSGPATRAGATTRTTAVWEAPRHRVARGASGRPLVEAPSWG